MRLKKLNLLAVIFLCVSLITTEMPTTYALEPEDTPVTPLNAEEVQQNTNRNDREAVHPVRENQRRRRLIPRMASAAISNNNQPTRSFIREPFIKEGESKISKANNVRLEMVGPYYDFNGEGQTLLDNPSGDGRSVLFNKGRVVLEGTKEEEHSDIDFLSISSGIADVTLRNLNINCPVKVNGSAILTVENCSISFPFESNKLAESNGAIMTFRNCTFYNACVHCVNGSKVKFENCEFISDYGYPRPNIFVRDSGTEVSCDSCVFYAEDTANGLIQVRDGSKLNMMSCKFPNRFDNIHKIFFERAEANIIDSEIGNIISYGSQLNISGSELIKVFVNDGSKLDISRSTLKSLRDGLIVAKDSGVNADSISIDNESEIASVALIRSKLNLKNSVLKTVHNGIVAEQGSDLKIIKSRFSPFCVNVVHESKVAHTGEFNCYLDGFESIIGSDEINQNTFTYKHALPTQPKEYNSLGIDKSEARLMNSELNSFGFDVSDFQKQHPFNSDLALQSSQEVIDRTEKLAEASIAGENVCCVDRFGVAYIGSTTPEDLSEAAMRYLPRFRTQCTVFYPIGLHDGQCAICLDCEGKDLLIRPCGHTLHMDCIKGHLRNTKKCPVCGMSAESIIHFHK